ncbi:MAG: CHAD domain-containing protein [Actinobacteria bacterium]|nr:CHAD domain-containing protein [Actinomycetota bacterium]
MTDRSAGDVVGAYLRAQVAEFEEWEASEHGLAAGLTHDGRVALRRLRSVLATYGSLFDAEPVRRIRKELRWFGLELSPLRDAEVAGARMRDGFTSDDAYAAGLVLEGYENLVQQARVQDVLNGVDGDRLAELDAALAAFAADPPLTRAAGAPAVDVLPALWEATRDVVRERLARTTGWGALAAWHEVRKAAKAARYGAEVLVPVLPAMEARRAEWERVTEALGAVMDAVITHREVTELALGAAVDGHPGALPARLWLREEERLTAALARGRKALTDALAD